MPSFVQNKTHLVQKENANGKEKMENRKEKEEGLIYWERIRCTVICGATGAPDVIEYFKKYEKILAY